MNLPPIGTEIRPEGSVQCVYVNAVAAGQLVELQDGHFLAGPYGEPFSLDLVFESQELALQFVIRFALEDLAKRITSDLLRERPGLARPVKE